MAETEEEEALSTSISPRPAVPGSIWLNEVERFFALTQPMIRRGTFHGAHELETAIYKWLASWNGHPNPFQWRASAEVILDKIRRCKELAATGE